MGSDVFVNGPWLCIGEPDYEAPKRAFEQMVQAYVPEFKFGMMSAEVSRALDALTAEQAAEIRDCFDIDGPWAFPDDYLSDNIQHMLFVIGSFSDYMNPKHSCAWSQKFSNGARWYVAAGESHGSYGSDVAWEMIYCNSKWFRMTGWKEPHHFNLTPKEVEE